MRLTDEQVMQDNKRFASCNALAELKYCGWDIPHRKSITNDEIHFYAWLYRSTVAMLKAKEPRVMKLEDAKAFEWDYCYLEEERLPGKEYRSVCGDYALTCITWPCVASMRIQYGDNNYGKKWRCWSAKPTDEQRQAVKWDE